MAHKVTEQTQTIVKALSSFGVPQKNIAKYLGICRQTLLNHYREILDTAQIDRVMCVSNSLFHAATVDNNVTAMIFYLKTQGSKYGWNVVETVEDDDKEDDTITKIEVEVFKGDDTHKM